MTREEMGVVEDGTGRQMSWKTLEGRTVEYPDPNSGPGLRSNDVEIPLIEPSQDGTSRKNPHLLVDTNSGGCEIGYLTDDPLQNGVLQKEHRKTLQN